MMSILSMPTVPSVVVLVLTHFLVGWLTYGIYSHNFCGG